MLFNSIEFVIFFVVVLATLVIIKQRRFQHLFLLFTSYFFFYYSSNYLLTLLIISTILDFYIGQKIWESSSIKKKKILLTISLAGNLGLLGFFKYTNFAITQFNILGNSFNLSSEIPLMELILPIGISFYTFQTISYTIDIYRGKLTPSKSFWEFALFVAFFPQLLAGPILRAKEFLPQLREKFTDSKLSPKLRQIRIQSPNLKFGITLMAFGFFKKMFIADNVSPLVNDIFNAPVGYESFTIILGAIGFGIQIYCDFSGYSDIAIGAAAILGFKIAINFNKPYFAISPSDFWQRWHISLSTWLRDYFYIPLGGNRKSKNRTYLNLMTVMVFGGLWHGASWNFIIWGTLHGVYLLIHKLLKNKIQNPTIINFFKSKIGMICSILITQYFIFLTWIPFRVQNVDSMIYSMQKYIFLDFEIYGTIDFIFAHKFPTIIIGFFVLLHYIAYKNPNLVERISKLKLSYWIIFLIIIMSLILFFYNGNPEAFIYFQF